MQSLKIFMLFAHNPPPPPLSAHKPCSDLLPARPAPTCYRQEHRITSTPQKAQRGTRNQRHKHMYAWPLLPQLLRRVKCYLSVPHRGSAWHGVAACRATRQEWKERSGLRDFCRRR